MNLLKAEARRLFPGTRIYLAGTVPQFTVMQDLVSRGQLTSFMVAMVVISLLLIIVFDSVKTGLVAMIPNITPALAVGGIMGWFGIPLDMTTITIMPMLLGLAVDDTIHFMTHFRLEMGKPGATIGQAAARSLHEAGQAVTFTSLILGSGFLVFILSFHNGISNFGIFSAAAIFAALAGDLFFLPALCRAANLNFKEA